MVKPWSTLCDNGTQSKYHIVKINSRLYSSELALGNIIQFFYSKYFFVKLWINLVKCNKNDNKIFFFCYQNWFLQNQKSVKI